MRIQHNITALNAHRNLMVGKSGYGDADYPSQTFRQDTQHEYDGAVFFHKVFDYFQYNNLRQLIQ